MNFDNIKELWDKEPETETPEISLEQQKDIHLPLEKIKSNMKKEFWSSIITFIIVCIFLLLPHSNDAMFSIYVLILSITLGITAYYFGKFYVLYKKISTQNLSTYHHLLNLRYELVLNTELYKSYYITFIPIFFVIYLIQFQPKIPNDAFLFFLSFLMMVVIITLYITGKIWLREFYGKHIQKISEIVDSLGDETDDFQYNRTTIKISEKLHFYTKTHRFLTPYFGKFAGIVNAIFWGIIGFILLFIISFAIGFIIGFFQIIPKDSLMQIIKKN